MTALAAALGASDTTLRVDAALTIGTFSYPLVYWIDDELVEVHGGAVTTTWIIDRGVSGTTPASHAAAATLTRYYGALGTSALGTPVADTVTAALTGFIANIPPVVGDDPGDIGDTLRDLMLELKSSGLMVDDE